MATPLRERIEYLFPDRGSCLIEVATIFAKQPKDWLTQEDIINLIGKKYPNSTIWSNFKKLSSPMEELDSQCYLDIKSLKNNRGRPSLEGKLSKAAHDSLGLYSLVKHTKEKPLSHILKLNGQHQIEIPPLKVRDGYISPKDMITFREQRIGKEKTQRLLKKIVNDNPMAEKVDLLKKIKILAKQQEIVFDVRKDNLFLKDGKPIDPDGELAEVHRKWKRLPSKEYRERARIHVFKHRTGPFPKREAITDVGLIELAADEWTMTLEAEMALSGRTEIVIEASEALQGPVYLTLEANERLQASLEMPLEASMALQGKTLRPLMACMRLEE